MEYKTGDKIRDIITDRLRAPKIEHRYGSYPYVYFTMRPRCEIRVGRRSYSNRFYPIKLAANVDQKLEIGRYTSIGDSLDIIMSGGHDPERLSSYPFEQFFNKKKGFTRGDIKIGNDVWIGSDVTIVGGGIRVGDGAVIGAKSLVTAGQVLDDYGIYAGVPAKLIRYRFKKSTIQELLRLKWWDMPEKTIVENADVFSMKNTDKAIKMLEKIAENQRGM